MQNDTTQAQTLPTSGTIDSRIGPLGFEGGYPRRRASPNSMMNSTSSGRCRS